MLFDTEKSILQEIQLDELKARNIRLLVKRDDLIHPEVSGNKWRKLKYIVAHFKDSKKEQILTFGGAYSNHLLATASACNQLGIKCIGLVRGEELTADSNPLLKRCAELGMVLHFVTRDEYALRGMKEYYEELIVQFPNSYIVPEGGANYYGMIGCQEIIKELPPFDHLFVAQGTATTSAGLTLGATKQKIHVVPALKGFDSKKEMTQLYLKSGFEDDLIEELLQAVEFHPDYHFGGYAKTTEELLDFIEYCDKNLQLPLDEVYTSKTFYCLLKTIENLRFDNSTIVFLHTGGLFLYQ